MSDSIDLDKINNLIEEGFIKKRAHPSGDLFILNYTDRAQYENCWTPETLMCRGLIVDKQGKIIARPFPKFFNLDQIHLIGEIPVEPFEVYEKLDGSLGIMYFHEGMPYIATRGSFDSEQAIVATEMLHLRLRQYDAIYDLSPDLTYLFEIIYPENRIVVDYGDKKSLTLIGLIETKTGQDIDIHLRGHGFFEKANKYDGISDLKSLEGLKESNKEGFVIKFQSGLRIKYKFEEYKKLHSFITEATSKKIWELLKDNKEFDELLSHIPDEMYNWVRETKESLIKEFDRIVHESQVVFESIKFIGNRKEFAQAAMSSNYPHILFAMLDKKDYTNIVWKLIEPDNELPYWNNGGNNE